MKNAAFLSILALTLPVVASAATVEVTVTIENMSPAAGTFVTPVWAAFHNGTFDIYDMGAPAGPGLERLAEDGNTAPIAQEFLDTGLGSTEGTIVGQFNGGPGPIPPGTTTSMTFSLDPASSLNRYFSYASMIIPSNDAFVATANPTAHPVFDGFGNFVGGSFVVTNARVRDAGTEVNDEIPANTAFFGQAAPDTGVVEGGVIAVHPGFMPVGSGGILDAPMFSNGDFTAPGRKIARITLSAARRTQIDFSLDGGQEVPPVVSNFTGACGVTLNTAQSELRVRCQHDVGDALAAHIHAAPAGENGPVVFDLGDPSSPIDATWQLSETDVDDLLNGDLYVNVHSPANPGGEVRGQIVGCIDGPNSICLNQGRFQVDVSFDPPNGDPGLAQAADFTDDSAYFTFFDPENVEIVAKVLDACMGFDRYWVFLSGLTNVEVDITVTDTSTGSVKTYNNPQGMAFMPILDTDAFATCP